MGRLYGTQNTFLSYQMGPAMNLDNLGLEDHFFFCASRSMLVRGMAFLLEFLWLPVVSAIPTSGIIIPPKKNTF